MLRDQIALRKQKERSMKKFLFVFVVVTLLLAACGGNAADTGPVDITFTMWGAEELAVGRQWWMIFIRQTRISL
jgi:ABC-type glycerol-3-phosphate transport system substrate-binding protein